MHHFGEELMKVTSQTKIVIKQIYLRENTPRAAMVLLQARLTKEWAFRLDHLSVKLSTSVTLPLSQPMPPSTSPASTMLTRFL